MGSIDKAAIVFSIAIALVGVGIAAVGNSADNTPTAAPFVSTQISEQKSLEEKTETTSLQDRQAEAAADMAAAEAAAEKAAAEAAAEKAAAEAAAEKAAAEAAAPKTVVVDIPVGTAVPGCETTDECFTPASISINAGDTVEWANVDTAAHTVTGGSPADGPSGVFDSSLLMGSGNYSFTFDDAGSYDYFCMVHPWMVGSVSVN
ncbi:MAG TPA: plastocyanin/azurin family copper-binding protein [Nitrosopumilus sp.]|nr:plastocyanin/azurin family copper-binding protein [Nitrosopumilus sp.]